MLTSSRALEDAYNQRSSSPPVPSLDEGPINLAGVDRSPEELTADYLRELYQHLIYTLEQKVGSRILNTIPLDFVLTVPAIWSEKAKERTLRACQRAGIKSDSDILLVSEPVSNGSRYFFKPCTNAGSRKRQPYMHFTA